MVKETNANKCRAMQNHVCFFLFNLMRGLNCGIRWAVRSFQEVVDVTRQRFYDVGNSDKIDL